MVTRNKDEVLRTRFLTRWLHGGLSKRKIGIQTQNKNEPSQCLPAIFWQAKHFGTAHFAAGTFKN
jgi:hypothetical protein